MAQHTTTPSSRQVLIHPACITNPDAVKAVQQATGRLIVLAGGRPRLASTPLPITLPAFEDFSGFDGGAA
ncbi:MULTISPECIES: hypothetical protein [unclassified Pseudomonas]|uniref:hypothetical protein n=1 Tax=unclassified Pseudomonas TaxID=196821 RepID=UPI002449F6B1|nr:MULTISPECIES: hypothetical protein [unclassified Pseudomonas]MDG9928510.1 hypothetical protein [Pseudomonas sp. GD04042]MDH0482680.1 hypothetical protein [Pseudomonas sp. GD04015]MDH0604618.1 hypothetical protein [Pseudomonas sp. GD03869]